MAWEENPRICLHMQLIAILSRIGVILFSFRNLFVVCKTTNAIGAIVPYAMIVSSVSY